MLTKEQKKNYINGGNCSCPFCGSSDIEGGHIEVDCNEAYQPIYCSSCEKAWNDIYRLTDIEEVE